MMPEKILNKGDFNAKCNIASCNSIEPATWFNQSTEKYYCTSCAHRLNYDPFNYRDSIRIYGSLLCVKKEINEQ